MQGWTNIPMIMAYKTFEETLPWKKVQDFMTSMYPVFKNKKEEWLVDELMDAGLQAATQIAKGYEINNDAIHIECLIAAKSQLAKCRSMLTIANRLKICKDLDFGLLSEKNTDAAKVIQGLIKYLKKDQKAA